MAAAHQTCSSLIIPFNKSLTLNQADLITLWAPTLAFTFHWLQGQTLHLPLTPSAVLAPCLERELPMVKDPECLNE